MEGTQKMQVDINLPITLSVTLGEAETIAKFLAKGPFEEVAFLMSKCRDQVQAQIAKTQEKEDEPRPAD